MSAIIPGPSTQLGSFWVLVGGVQGESGGRCCNGGSKTDDKCSPLSLGFGP